VFGCRGGNTKYANVKLVDILGNDKYDGFVGRHLAAICLNIIGQDRLLERADPGHHVERLASDRFL